MLIAIWLIAAFFIVLWTLASWGLHALLTLDPRWVGDAGRVIEQVPYGEWIERWIPGWQDLLRLAVDTTQTALQWIGSAAPLVTWVVWGLGTVLIIGIGALLTLIVQLLRPRRSEPAGVAQR